MVEDYKNNKELTLLWREQHRKLQVLKCKNLEGTYSKGQLISKRPSKQCLQFDPKTNKNFLKDFCPSLKKRGETKKVV